LQLFAASMGEFLAAAARLLSDLKHSIHSTKLGMVGAGGCALT
jgi:hypothetical protein